MLAQILGKLGKWLARDWDEGRKEGRPCFSSSSIHSFCLL